jgi:hypothetical protein
LGDSCVIHQNINLAKNGYDLCRNRFAGRFVGDIADVAAVAGAGQIGSRLARFVYVQIKDRDSAACCANSRAVAFPSPLRDAAPVMIAVLPSKSFIASPLLMRSQR